MFITLRWLQSRTAQNHKLNKTLLLKVRKTTNVTDSLDVNMDDVEQRKAYKCAHLLTHYSTAVNHIETTESEAAVQRKKSRQQLSSSGAMRLNMKMVAEQH
jgi:hypothetical protein